MLEVPLWPSRWATKSKVILLHKCLQGKAAVSAQVYLVCCSVGIHGLRGFLPYVPNTRKINLIQCYSIHFLIKGWQRINRICPTGILHYRQNVPSNAGIHRKIIIALKIENLQSSLTTFYFCFKWGYKTWNAVALTDWDQIILSSEVYSDLCNTIKVLMKKCISLKPRNSSSLL